MPDVSALVHQMHDILSQIHETITSLDTKNHDEKLDALEAEQDSLFEKLQTAYHKQREELEQRRKSEQDEIAEKRRREDEEIAARRKREDEELQTRAQSENAEREKKLEEERKAVESETDTKMEEVEAEAQRMLDEGHSKISELEQKRREINNMIDEQMKAPLPPPPKRRRGTRSAPAQKAPPAADAAQPEQKDESREIAAEESAGAAQPQEESREMATEAVPEPEKASAEEAAPKEAVPEESVNKQTPQADSVAEEPSAQNTSREVESEDAKPETGSTDPAPAQENQHQEDLSKIDLAGPQDVSEDKTSTNEHPEGQQESTSEPKETADTTESVQEMASAEPELNTADQHPGDGELAPAEEEKTAGNSSDQTEEAARDIQPEASGAAEVQHEPSADKDAQVESHTSDHQAEDSVMEEKTTADEPTKPHEDSSAREIPTTSSDISEAKHEPQDDNVGKGDLNGSDHQAQDRELTHDEEKTTSNEPSAHQEEEATQEVPYETTDSKEDPVADAPTATELAGDAPHDEQPTATQSESAEDTSSVTEPTQESTKEEEKDTGRSDPTPEGIVKGGAAEEYLQMADAEPDSRHEESAPASGAAVDKDGEHETPGNTAREIVTESAKEPSDEQATSQKDVESTGPAETSDTDHAEAEKEGIDSGAPAQEEKESAVEPSSDDHHEAVPAEAQAETTAAHVQPEAGSEAQESDKHEAGEGAAKGVDHDEQSSEAVPQEHRNEQAAVEGDSTKHSASEPQVESESSATAEAEPQSRDINEATQEETEAEPELDQTPVSSHGDSSSPTKADVEQHATEHPEPQHVEQADTSPEGDHHEHDQQDPSPAPSSEHKDQDVQVSRNLEDDNEQRDAEHNADHADNRAPDDSVDSVAHDGPSVDQAALSEPSTSQPSETQQGEDAQKEDSEEVLEGSGNDSGPFRGSDVKDSGDRPAEENFDLSGHEPIPGTMTHGVDPEGAEKGKTDADALPIEVGEVGTDRGVETGPFVDHAREATDSHEGVLSRDTHDDGTEEHGAVDDVSEHQPAGEAHHEETIDKAEHEEQPRSKVSDSLDQDSAAAEGQSRSERPQEDSGETLADGPDASTADHPTEVEPSSRDIDAVNSHHDEPNEERSVVEDSEVSTGNKTPEILVSEHKPTEDGHEQDSKPHESPDESSSRTLDMTGPDSAKAQHSEDAWEDRHASDVHAARRPSTIHTDNIHPDDDADAGLFAVPPTPRDEVDQQQPTSLRTPSPPQAGTGKVQHEAAGAPLPPTAEESHDMGRGIESSAALGHEVGAEHQAMDDHVEEDKSSQPPWLAQQNGQSDDLPTLQTGSGERDADAHHASSPQSRDGSYHEDFQLSPVAYTPVDKKSRSVESFEKQKADESKGHDTQGHDEKAAGVGPAAPVEEHIGSDATHQALSHPDDMESQQPADHSSTPGIVDQPGEMQEEGFSKSIPQEDHIRSAETTHDESFGGHDDKADDVVVPPHSYGVNYDGDGYGPSPSEEQHFDAGASPYPQTGQDAAPFSPSDDRTETASHYAETPRMATGFSNDQHPPRAETPEQFNHALGNLPDESAHTVQGTDDLFEDDDDDSASEYGEAIVETTEKLVYSASGSEENVALGGNQSSLSLGRNSMASQRSYGHRSVGSRSSLGSSVRETTPLRVMEGAYVPTSPTVVRADWAGDYPDDLRPRSRATPQLQPSALSDSPSGISPFALRNTPMGGNLGDDDDDARGLSASRWSPRGAARPETPPSRTTSRQAAAAESPQTPGSATRLGSNNPFRAQQSTPERPDAEEVDPSLYMPRDVTNMPWHARNDSIPVSLHSQTTLSSFQDSPIHSSLPVDKHEPVIRDSWPAPAPGYQQYLSSWGGRPRGDSSLSSNNGDYDPFKADANGNGNGNGNVNVNKSSIYNPFQQRGRAESAVSAAPSANSAASASPSRGSGLFQKMRNVFEQGSTGAGAESPGLTRPVSGTYHAVSPLRSPARPDQTGGTQGEQGYSNRSGY